MKNVIVVRPYCSTDELQDALRQAKLMQAIGVIVTEPKNLSMAQEFDAEIIAMFGKTEQALKAAQEISEASDSAVVVIGEPSANTDGPQ
jgi:hypothetical protein